MKAASHISIENIHPILEKALHSRRDMLSQPHHSAVRLFNGFLEGFPRLVVDVFGHTLVIQSFFKPHEIFAKTALDVWSFYISRLDWLSAVLLKIRHTRDAESRNGTLVYGNAVDDRVRENGVWYALDLQMNQDTGLYLDTRNLRKWLIEKMNNKSVLNLFAYTGSLGVAAWAGGARRVVQVDRNRKFLNLAHASYTLNGFKISRADLVGTDFWIFTARMRRAKALFDCVLLDPPFFSTTSQGNLQLEHHTRRLVNKVRPLVSHDGYLIVINNALYLSGQEYYKELEELGSDGHLALEEIIPVPTDITGDENTRQEKPPVDPAPFNHSTKIAILRVHRKDRLTSRDIPPPTIRG